MLFSGMSRFLLAAVVGLTLTASSAPVAQAANDETTRINVWFEARFEEQIAFSPIQQTFLGRKSRAINDMSVEAQDKQTAWQRTTVANMKKNFD